jgi:hypothetical protein
MNAKPALVARPIQTIHAPAFDRIDGTLVALMIGIVAFFFATL